MLLVVAVMMMINLSKSSAVYRNPVVCSVRLSHDKREETSGSVNDRYDRSAGDNKTAAVSISLFVDVIDAGMLVHHYRPMNAERRPCITSCKTAISTNGKAPDGGEQTHGD